MVTRLGHGDHVHALLQKLPLSRIQRVVSEVGNILGRLRRRCGGQRRRRGRGQTRTRQVVDSVRSYNISVNLLGRVFADESRPSGTGCSGSKIS